MVPHPTPGGGRAFYRVMMRLTEENSRAIACAHPYHVVYLLLSVAERGRNSPRNYLRGCSGVPVLAAMEPRPCVHPEVTCTHGGGRGRDGRRVETSAGSACAGRRQALT